MRCSLLRPPKRTTTRGRSCGSPAPRPAPSPWPAPWPVMAAEPTRGSEGGPDRVQLGEEREVEDAAQERRAARPAGPAAQADGALDGLEVAEAPELQVVLDVDELLAGLVDVPVLLRGVVDRAEHLDQARVLAVGLAHVALQQVVGHREAAAGEQVQELVVEAAPVQRRGEHRERRLV